VHSQIAPSVVERYQNATGGFESIDSDHDLTTPWIIEPAIVSHSGLFVSRVRKDYIGFVAGVGGFSGKSFISIGIIPFLVREVAFECGD
jgi:hypothetical protein